MAAAILLPRSCRVYPAAELITELRRRDKLVLTFLGYGELGYEDVGRMRAVVRSELHRRSRADTVVNSGTLITAGFHSGIAEAYRDAKEMGFATTGIHPSVALREPWRHQLSCFVDEPFFVQDESWGGYLPETNEPSPTLQVLVAVSHEVLVIGGGRHTADEMGEFLRRGIPVRFHEAEMNHGTGVAWYRSQGITEVDFRGEAYHLWHARRRRLRGDPAA